MEPDPDNAGGGKEAALSWPSAEGFFILLPPSDPVQLPSLSEQILMKGGYNMKWPAFNILMVLFIFTTSGPALADRSYITLMTHDSFAVSEGLLKIFEKRYGAEIKILKSGDAGAVLNQAILSRKNPLADVFFGVDNTFMSRALEADIFIAYAPSQLADVPDSLKLDSQNRLIPVDYGDVCLNYDKKWFRDRKITPPQGLNDLVKPEYRGLTVVQNPATSSPGLAFLLTTVGAYGEDGYLDWWRKMRRNDVYVTAGWSDAYYGQFSRAKGGTRPIVVSYASSPPAEVYYSEKKVAEAPTASVLSAGSAFRQIEFVGILKNGKNSLRQAIARIGQLYDSSPARAHRRKLTSDVEGVQADQKPHNKKHEKSS